MEIEIVKADVGESRDKCFAIRQEVFVVEQKVDANLEYDDFDSQADAAVHYLVTNKASGEPLATARARVVDSAAKIERVAVAQAVRGHRVGFRLMQHIIADVRGWEGVCYAKLGSQNHAIPFYEKLGFHAYGDEYDDAGIPHHDMRLDFEN